MSGKKLGRNPFEKRPAAPARAAQQAKSPGNGARVLHAEARASRPATAKRTDASELPGGSPRAGELAQWTIAFSAGVCLLGLRAAILAYDMIFPEKGRAA